MEISNISIDDRINPSIDERINPSVSQSFQAIEVSKPSTYCKHVSICNTPCFSVPDPKVSLENSSGQLTRITWEQFKEEKKKYVLVIISMKYGSSL